tara:strand:- start:383 stop:1246 length:864 start_codon:yes stop_codon:yes gene_type:complete
MKNIIFSIFIDLENNNGVHVYKANQLKDNLKLLVKLKEQYANHIGAEFKLFTNDNNWKIFKEKYKDYEYDVVNLYKIYLLEKLSNDYDNVLYLDLDVVPNTNECFFTKFDMNKICMRSINATTDVLLINHQQALRAKRRSYVEIMKVLDKYNEHIKALCKKAMLINQNIVSKDYELVNTGIVGGNKKSISNLKFTERLDDMLQVLSDTKKEQFYGEDITKFFFANNEVFVHYLLDKYNIDWFNLPESWHKIHYRRDLDISPEYKEAHMIHLISKKFDELWKVLNVEK